MTNRSSYGDSDSRKGRMSSRLKIGSLESIQDLTPPQPKMVALMVKKKTMRYCLTGQPTDRPVACSQYHCFFFAFFVFLPTVSSYSETPRERTRVNGISSVEGIKFFSIRGMRFSYFFVKNFRLSALKICVVP